MNIKAVNYDFSKKNLVVQTKSSEFNTTTKYNSVKFCGNPTKNIKDLSRKEIIKTKIENFFSMQRIAHQCKKMIKEVSQRYLKDSEIENNNLLTFEKTFWGGYFNPIDSGIVINKREPKFVALSKFLPEYFDFEKNFKSCIFRLACHESQHKVQATQVYRLANNQENFTNLLVDYVKNENKIIKNLKNRTVFDDKLEESTKKLRLTTDKKEKLKIKLEIKKLKTAKNILMGQVKSEERKIEKFDINKVKSFYDKVLERKGIIPKASAEEITAKKYLEGFRTYPLILSNYQSIKEFGSQEAHEVHCSKLMSEYKNNFLEIDANQKAQEYIEKNIDLFEQYFKKINH